MLLRLLVLLLFGAVLARADTDLPSRAASGPQKFTDLSQFTFARGSYDSEGGMGEAYYAYDGRVWARWETDYPEADQNFARRLSQLTRINTNPVAAHRPFSAPDIGDFPLLYVADPGWMRLTHEEEAGLARYLANGGFLWVDDFWGDAEFEQFADAMRAVLPKIQWRALPVAHPIFHTVFDMQTMPQIPALTFAMRTGATAEPPRAHKYPAGSTNVAQMRAWADESGRVMVVATHNTDLGDGFEREAYGEWYFETFSTKAYMLGVNIVAYAMMH
ncbi:MAG: DUF4159 domain-containing protein [Steroidobacteraceae bacterium]